jgi:hypothetical protein
MKKIMTEDVIGGRPVDITKEDGKVKIVFHPIHGKNPKAALFTVTFSSSDISKMKKAL